MIDRLNYAGVYRLGKTNYCPGCGRSNWHIGRVSAECAFCSAALPLEEPTRAAARPVIYERGRKHD